MIRIKSPICIPSPQSAFHRVQPLRESPYQELPTTLDILIFSTDIKEMGLAIDAYTKSKNYDRETFRVIIESRLCEPTTPAFQRFLEITHLKIGVHY